MQEEKLKEYLSQNTQKKYLPIRSDARSAERSLGDLDEFFEEYLDQFLIEKLG